MKKILALLLIFAFVCTTNLPGNVRAEMLPDFSGLDDPTLLRYIQDDVYEQLIDQFDSDEFFVENVNAIYISKEYLYELAYNSQTNIYFGYTLAELEAQFEGTKFVLALGEDGQTAVQAFKEYDDTYDRIIRNVAIGTGVILLCVTVSVVTAGVGAPAISVIFAASAKSATIFALSSGAFSGIAQGIITGIQTNDFDQSLKAGALAGSEGFKWGAIGGGISGGASQAVALKGATLNGLTMNQAAAIQRESKYPLDVIKGLKTVEQYDICKTAGLKPQAVNGKMALVRNVDANLVDDFGRTNIQRMSQGFAALDSTGQAYELHHIGQKVDSTLAILTKAEHMQGGNNTIWHNIGQATEVHGLGNDWASQAKAFWKAMAKSIELAGGI